MTTFMISIKSCIAWKGAGVDVVCKATVRLKQPKYLSFEISQWVALKGYKLTH